MTDTDLLNRLKVWLRVVGLGRVADAIDGYIEICKRDDFDELVTKRKSE